MPNQQDYDQKTGELLNPDYWEDEVGLMNECKSILTDIVLETRAIVDTDYQSPDIYICPFCEEMTIEKNGKIPREEQMNSIRHKKGCSYVKAVLFLDKTKGII
jgi:hypothetical protein